MKGNATAEAMQSVADAVQDLRADVRALKPAVRPSEPRGYVSDLERFPALRMALRFCRDGAEGLARLFRRVPDEHRDGLVVRCVCGAEVVASALLVACSGGCGRWFVGDDTGVWAAKLPAGDDEGQAS